MFTKSKLLNFLFFAIILAAWFMYSECSPEDESEDPPGTGTGSGNGKPVALFTIAPEPPIVDQLATLDGQVSSGEELTFLWDITEAPAQSNAVIQDPTFPVAYITPDREGTFEIKLCVTDKNDIDSCISMSFDPIVQFVDAIVGDDLFLDIGEIVPLAADHSTPYFALLFSWALLDKPALSTLTSASIVPPNGVSVGFFMDEPGIYEVELRAQYMGDENIYDTDTVLVTANPPEIESFNPGNGPAGTALAIYGKNFSSDLGGNTLELNGVETTIYLASSTELITTVPQGATSGTIKVKIQETGDEAESENNFIVDESGWLTVLTGVGALYDVDFADQNSGVAVGSSGSIYKTSDGGFSWNQVNSNTTEPLKGVSFGNPTTCYAVGYYGSILKSTDSGNSWSTLSSVTSSQLNSVYFINESTGYVVGSSSPIVLYTEDGGISWEDRTPPFSTYYDVFFMDTIGFVSGGSAIFHTENGGESWSNAQSGYYVNIYNGVSFITPYKGWVVGGPVSFLGESHIAHTVDGGITYNPQSHGVQETLFDVDFINENGIVAGDNGTILRTEDGGENWIQEESGTNAHLQAVHLFETGEAIIVGYYQGGIILRRVQ